MKILLSEGSSLSARETVSALGPLGYEIYVCDPNPICICRFSKYVKKIYKCPVSGENPIGYMNFIIELLKKEHFDVLLPVHEQAFIFSKFKSKILKYTGIAITDFNSLKKLQSKNDFLKLLKESNIPYPKTVFCKNEDEILKAVNFPCYIKTEYGTASSGVWKAENMGDVQKTISIIKKRGILNGENEVLVQQVSIGVLEIVYACFNRGELIAVHCAKREMEGARGSSSAKVGVDRHIVVEHMKKLGQSLKWHGSLAVDYLYDEKSNTPYYIDASPRLVEPMSGVINGVNIPELLVKLSLKEQIQSRINNSPKIKTHMTMMSICGIADRGAGRIKILKELLNAVNGKEIYKGSKEELTNIKEDFLSIIPILIVFIRLMINPKIAAKISEGTVKNYALTQESIETIIKVIEC